MRRRKSALKETKSSGSNFSSGAHEKQALALERKVAFLPWKFQ